MNAGWSIYFKLSFYTTPEYFKEIKSFKTTLGNAKFETHCVQFKLCTQTRSRNLYDDVDNKQMTSQTETKF